MLPSIHRVHGRIALARRFRSPRYPSSSTDCESSKSVGRPYYPPVGLRMSFSEIVRPLLGIMLYFLNFRFAQIAFCEHLIDVHLTYGETLLVRIARHCRQRLAIFFYTVGPELLTHDLGGGLIFSRDPGQPDLERGSLAKIDVGKPFCLEIGFVQAGGQPAVLIVDVAADAERVHDRKDAGAFEIVAFGGAIVRKQPPNLRMLVDVA